MNSSNANSRTNKNFKALNEPKSLLSYKNRKPHQWVLFQVNTIHKMRCPSYQMNPKRKTTMSAVKCA